MNKIYKVVWNAARNCYVVGSEFISKTRRGGGYRSNVTTAGARTLLAVCAACGISFYSGGLAVAADNLQTEPTIVIEVQEQKNEAVQPELLYSQLAAASASADALDTTMPADVSAAAEDTSEAPAVDVTSQHSVHDENGYYVYNGTENDTYNSLTKDGLWVGGVDDNTGFHVDNTGHASANGLDVQNKKITNVNDIVMQVETYNPSGNVLGYKALSFKDAGIVPGTVSGDDNTDSVVIGRDSKSSKKHSVVVGDGARALGMNATAIGTGASAEMDSSVAIGSGSQVGTPSAVNGTAVGAGSKVTAKNGTAVGQGAFAWGTDSTVLGASARVERNADGSVALGKDSYAKASDILDSDTKGVVSVGKSGNNGFTRRIINVADGVNDNDAATYGQVKGVQADVDALDALAVQYDGASKSQITFAGTNGTALNNVSDIVMNVEDPINHKAEQHSFQNAGLLPGKVGGTATDGKWNMAIGEGSEIEVGGGTGANMKFNTAIGNSAGVSQAIVDDGYEDVERSTAIGHAAKVRANNSTAIGDSSNVSKDNSVAVGQKAEVQSATSIAIGQGTKIGGNAENSIAIGTSANGYSVGSKAKNSTVVGVSAWSLSEGGTVLGKSAKIQGSAANGTAIGTNATINVSAGSGNVALGADSTVSKADVGGDTAHGVVSVGQSGDNGFTRRIINVADGVNDSDAATYGQVKAVQSDIDALDERAVTYTDSKKEAVNFNKAKLQNIGDIQLSNATSTFVGSGLVNGKVYDTEKGQWAENGAEDTHSMAVGSKSSVRGKYSIAVGPEATVNNGNSRVLEQSTAVGSKATVTSSFSTALGANTQAKGDYSVAIGAQSQTTGANATAIGAYAAAGKNSVVVGGGEGLAAPAVSQSNGTAMGTYVDIKSDNGTALGYGSQVGGNGKNSVALGADSVANEENVVSVGHTKGQTNGFGGTYGEDLNRRITNVADGKNANDAATVGQISKITGMDSEKGNVVQYDGKDKSVVTFAGENGTKLTNLAAGEFKADSTDAVTAGQLYASGIVPGSIVDGSGTGKGNMALGNMSEIEAGDGMDYNTAIGYNAGISQEYVIGKGYENAENSTAIGASARIYGSDSVAVGHQSSVTHKQGVAIGQGAKVESANSVAVGHEAIIKGNAENSIAIGNSKTYDPETGLGGGATQSVASGAKNSTVIGVGGATTSEGAVVLGYEARVNGSAANATAIGKDATIQVSSGNGNVALGAESEVSKADVGDDTAHGVVSIGKSGDDGFTRRIVNVADGLNDSDAATVGQLNAVQSAYTNSGIVGGSMDNNTLATGAVAIGKDSKVHGTGSVAIGTGSKVEQHNSVAIGRNAIVKGKGSVALGASSVATEDNVLSLGRKDGSLGLRIVNMKDGINERDAVTVGQMNALALGDRNGSLSLANGATNLADGIDRNTTDIKSLNGQLADAMVDWEKGTQNMKDLTAKASAFAAQTQNVDWNALNSVDWNAVNAMAAVPATMNLAVDDVQANEGDTGAEKDDDARSPQTNGSNPGEVDGNLHVSGNTTLDGTLNVKGDATFEGNATFDKGATMKGDLNMSGNKITGLGAGDVSADSTDAVNGSQLFDVQQQVSDNRQAIGALGSRVSDLGEEVDSVGAISAALAGLHPLDYNGTGSKFQISAALGTYDGTQAAAIGGFYHFNRDTLLSIGGSTSFEGDRKTAANVGVTFRVGEGASEAPAVQDNETKQQMEAMKQEIEMLKAELEQLKNKDTEGTNDKN